MMWMWRLSRLQAIGLSAIGLVNVWLLVVVMLQVLSDDLPSADKHDWTFTGANAMANAANRRPIDAYERTLARPIFFKSREPFVPAPPQPVKVAPPPVVVDPGLALGGVMIKNGVRKAYLFSKSRADVGEWISEREKFMGWDVKSISQTGAKLEQHGRSIELQLYPDR